MKYCRVILLILFFSLGNVFGKTNNTTIVVAEILRIREQPSLESKVIGNLKKGSILNILAKSKYSTRIDELDGLWYQIQYEDITGWVFSGYLFDRYYINENTKIAAWLKHSGNDLSCKFVLFNLQTTEQISFNVSGDSCSFEISPNLKYVAIDSGTDTIGNIEIWDIYKKKRLYYATYTREIHKWDGNKISIEEINWKENQGDCRNKKIYWKETIFDDGKIYRGDKTGWVPDPC